MSMSTHAVGFRPADQKWRTMKSAWYSCVDAGVTIPDEVSEFFDHEAPGDKPGMEVDLGKSVVEWCGEGCSGLEVDISKIPKDVTVLRFYNAW